MSGSDQAPFSARHRGAHAHIDREFPQTARVGLLHLLHDLQRKGYVNGWDEIDLELQRIARTPPVHMSSPSAHAATVLEKLPWDKVFDFCERLYGHLAIDVGYRDQDGDFQVTTPKRQVQAFIASELQRLFLEEGLAFEFRDGLVQRRGRRHTVERTSRAEVVLGDARLDAARRHYEKALKFFRDATKPDYENAVKEAVCAVEAAGKALFPDAKASTLGDLTKWLTREDTTKLPKSISQTLAGLYAFRSGGEGVAHGAAVGGAVTAEIAEFVLAVAASQIILLVDLANAHEPEIPF